MASIDLLDQIAKIGATNEVGSLGFTGLTNPAVEEYEKKKLADQVASDLAKASAGGSDPSLPSQQFNGSFGQFAGLMGNALGALSGLVTGNPLSVVSSGRDLLSYDPAKPTMTSLVIDSILSSMGINQIGATQAPAPIVEGMPTSVLGATGLPDYTQAIDNWMIDYGSDPSTSYSAPEVTSSYGYSSGSDEAETNEDGEL